MAFKKATAEVITIKAPKFEVLTITLVGTAPYVSNNFSQEARDIMAADQAAGAKAGQAAKKKLPKDFDKGYRGSMHVAKEGGWHGIPATALRAACIRACSVVGVEMTKAKMCVFVLPDGYEYDGTPLMKISKGRPERFDSYVRNDNGGADIRPRARWAEGWEVVCRLRFDADLFTKETIVNLVSRAGMSVGLGAGRPFSKDSNGMGWGTFEIKTK